MTEASRGPSEPRRPPTAPASPAALNEAQLAAFRRRRSPGRPPCKGRDLQGAGLRVRDTRGEDSDPSQQQLADARLQVGGPDREKLPNLKTVKDIVGDLGVALSTSVISITIVTQTFLRPT